MLPLLLVLLQLFLESLQSLHFNSDDDLVFNVSIHSFLWLSHLQDASHRNV